MFSTVRFLAVVLVGIITSVVVSGGLRAQEVASATAHSDSSQANHVSSRATALATIYAGLVGDFLDHPDRDPVVTYATGLGWKPVPVSMLAMLNAKVAYWSKVQEVKVVLGSNGSGIMSISVAEKMDSKLILEAIRSYFTAERLASEIHMGQQEEVYQLRDHGKSVGKLTLIYGVADGIKGSGTIGYLSDKQAATVGF